MCTTCGCGKSSETAISAKKHHHAHIAETPVPRMIQLKADLLAKNKAIAETNRDYFKNHGIKTLNLVSSPGSGKTTLLTETLQRLGPSHCAVIEGDQQTSNDAQRIRATGTRAIQINTGKCCHLDAHMVAKAINELDLEQSSLLFIENVGNLICPASFDLGEADKVVVVSVTEGDDKPLKYPDIFAGSSLMLINKVDLLPYVDFDPEACIKNARRINPAITPLLISATTGEGMPQWLNWLGER